MTDRQSTDYPAEIASDGFRGVVLDGALVRREVNVTLTVENPDYRFMVDGEGPGSECGRLLRRAVDECDTQGEDMKYGGRVVGESAVWEIGVFGGAVVD